MKSRPGIGLPSAKRYAGSIAVSVAPISTITQDMYSHTRKIGMVAKAP